MTTNNRYLNDLEKMDLWTPTVRFFSFCFKVCQEIYRGVRYQSLPAGPCLFGILFFMLALHLRWDVILFAKCKILFLYPRQTTLFKFYKFMVTFMPFWLWGIFRVGQRRKLQRQLDEVFDSCGLRMGSKYPQLIVDIPVGNNVRKLKVTREFIPHEAFVRAKCSLEGALGAYIRDFKEQRSGGTEEIYYSSEPETDSFPLTELKTLEACCFVVGKKSGNTIYGNLKETPHLLIAGETGGGKSTFLRQLIVSLYKNDSSSKFTLIDLKAGLEFYLFKDLPRVQIATEIDKAVIAISNLDNELNRRFRILEDSQCRDLDAYQEADRKKLSTHIIVIDEVAELFLSGRGGRDGDLEKARGTLNRIARQGRAVGIHLIVATQRPDSRTLDPQIKANLNGVLCFAMVNDASSISVLGNGQATELPPVKGRAIWKNGNTLTEVQTPLFEESSAKSLLERYKTTPIIEKKEETKSNRHEPI